MMALSDITPQQLIDETANAKKTAKAILILAVYVDDHADALWEQYGKSWATMTAQQKAVTINIIAAEAGVVLSSGLNQWFVSFMNLLINNSYKAVLLSRLREEEISVTAKLSAIQAKIEALET
jgi:hypothetical protein